MSSLEKALYTLTSYIAAIVSSVSLSHCKSATATQRKQRDELLVYGFVRDVDDRYPGYVMDLCLLWFHNPLYFMKAGSFIEINEDGNIAKITSDSNNSVYGSVVMPSQCDIEIEYEYKMKIDGVRFNETDFDSLTISIGIDDAECKHAESDFSGNDETCNYGYYGFHGRVFSHVTGRNFHDAIELGQSYGIGDTISMCYNPYKSTLSYAKNGEHQGVIESIESKKGLQYRLCICLGQFHLGLPGFELSVELMSDGCFFLNV